MAGVLITFPVKYIEDLNCEVVLNLSFFREVAAETRDESLFFRRGRR